jgi:hypothetical protein
VEVDTETFRIFHNVRPAEANFPRSVRVIFDTDRPAEEAEEVEEAEEAEVVEEEVN